ncbi:MAG: hypothetical protein U1E70_02390 [Acetobacteraceae bacterium]
MGSLFGMMPGSVKVKEGVDLTEPVPEADGPFDGETGAKIDR